jgi:hypothetical protein
MVSGVPDMSERITQVVGDEPSRARWLILPVALLLFVVPVGWFLLTAPPAPADGSVRVTMAAGWAWVEVDGARVGQAPGVFTVKPGQHALRFAREGFQPQTRMVDVAPGTEQVLDITLAP